MLATYSNLRGTEYSSKYRAENLQERSWTWQSITHNVTAQWMASSCLYFLMMIPLDSFRLLRDIDLNGQIAQEWRCRKH